MSIYFVRHIKTVYNQFGLISGCTEADVLEGQKLADDSAYPEAFDIALCSSLKRCIKTLELLPAGICKEIIYTETLVERDVGVLEGMNRERAIQTYPDFFCNGKLDVNAAIPGGESIGQVKERTKELTDYLRHVGDEKNVLVCSHNQTLKIIFAALKDIPIDNDYWHHFNFKNGKVVDISHLSYPLSHTR